MHRLKRGLVFGLALLVPLCALALAKPALAQKPDKKIRVLVLPFSVNAGPELGDLRKTLPALLADRLSELGIDPVDAKTAASLIASRKVKSLDLATAQDLARAAKASFAVYGTFNQVGDDLNIDARLVEAKGAKKAVQLTSTAKGAINVKTAVDSLADSVRESVAFQAAQTAQTGKSADQGKADLKPGDKIAAVAVEGNVVLDKDVILLRLKNQPGDTYDPRAVNEDLKRLYELGFFDDVQIRVDEVPGGKKLVYVVKEKPKIMAISVSGSSAIDKDDVLAAMSTKTGAVLNLKTLSEDLGKIRDLYVKKGYYNIDVTYKLEQTDPRQARLDIVVKETGKLFIKKIDIIGAKQISASDLKGELSLSERGFLSWLTGSGVLKEDMLERDVAAIESYYANRGYIDARCGQPDVEFKDDGIYITFRVEEGKRYKVGKVYFKGDLLDSPEALMIYTSLDEMSKSASWFDRSVVRNDLNALTEFYADQGYAYAQADMELNKDTSADSVDVTYVLNKGPKVYVRRVLIEGNEKTRDNVIRREIKLGDGDMFSGSKLRRSNERLNKLNYFSKIDIDPTPTGNPQEMDLKVTVKDKNTGSLNFGGGFSTSDSVFVGGSIEEKNLFGKGYVASLSGLVGGKSSRYVISLANPRLYDTLWFGSIDLYNTYQRYENFNKATTGGKLRIGHPLGEYTEAALEYRLDFYDITDVNAFSSPYIVASAGNQTLSSAYVFVSRDTTDSKTKPTKGTIAKVSAEYAGGILGGTNEFAKFLARGDYYRPTWFDQVFHFRVQLGWVVATGSSSIPIFERFYLGGINSIRGYAVNQIAPRDPLYYQQIGGTAEGYFNLEYIVPLNKNNGIYGIAFFDAGNAWMNTDNINPTSLFKGVGAGIRWFSPMGLFNVVLGYGLDADLIRATPWQIGFSMGQQF